MDNFIGQYFHKLLVERKFDRKELARLLGWDYKNNDRMICAYFKKSDRLWRESEVSSWCKALHISSDKQIYNKLMSHAGKKDL